MHAIVLSLLLVLGGSAIADDRRLHVAIEIEHALPATTIEDLTSRLVVALCDRGAGRTMRSATGDRIRLTVSVRPVSATTLRGFWLPFSGLYGVGTMRLTVEQMVTVPGVERPVPAVVWQAERSVAGPWRKADQAVARSLDELASDLRAAGPDVQCGPSSSSAREEYTHANLARGGGAHEARHDRPPAAAQARAEDRSQPLASGRPSHRRGGGGRGGRARDA